jgi:ATP/ADP translocase
MNFLKIKEEELQPLILLFVIFFCIVSTSITGSSVRDTFFLINFDKSYLPVMYILIAVSMAWIISIYKKTTSDKNLISIITITNFIFFIPILFIKFNLNGIFIPIFYIWIEIITVLSILQFWMLAGDVFNPRQAKRLFTLIGAGGSFSGIVIGYIIKPYVAFFGTENLLNLTIFFIFLTIYFIRKIDPFIQRNPIKKANFNTSNSKPLVNLSPYIKYIAIMVAFSAVISKIVDYQFKIMASNTFTNQDELISFFGSFYIFTGIATLIMQFFVTNFVLRYFGILLGLMILPTMLTMSSAVFLFTGTFSAIYLAKFSDQVFKFSINNSIQEILWLPIKVKIKKLTKPLIDGTLKSSVEGLAGFFIFILTFYNFITESKVYILSIIIILGAIFWIYNNFKIKNGYISSLIESIQDRDLFIDDVNFNINDSQIVKTIDRALNSKNEFKQLFALDLLWKQNLNPWLITIKNLFKSKSYKVRRAVLELTWKKTEILSNDMLIEIIKSDDEVKPFAIACIGDRRVSNLDDLLEPYLISDSILLVASSSASIIKYNSKHEKALSVIKEILNNSDHEKIIILLSFLKELGDVITDKQYIHYFQKGPYELKIECLEILEKSPRVSLTRTIIKCLSDPLMFSKAEKSLLNIKKDLILKEFNSLLSINNLNEKLNFGILKTLHNYDHKKAISLNIKALDNSVLSLVNKACNNLIDISKHNTLSDETLQIIDEKIYKFASQAFTLHLLQNKILDDKNAFIIHDYIKCDLKLLIEIILKLGTFKDPTIPIETYIRYIQAKDPRFLPLVIELIDTTFTKKNKKVTLPLIESDTDVINSLSKIFPFKEISKGELLINWAKSNDEWKIISFIHYLLLKEDANLLSKLNWNEIDNKIFSTNLFSFSEKNYINRNFLNNKLIEQEKGNMYSILEKTIILKSIDLFSQIPSHILTKIGDIASEINYDKGFEIFKKGDFGDSLFVIVKGKVNIIQNHNSIAILETGSCIGEMALLDHEPRSADAKTMTDVVLLQIDQNTFYDLMAKSPDIMKQIINILIKRLRDVNQKLINVHQ